MALAHRMLLVVLALTSSSLARAETLDCEFHDGRTSSAQVDAKTVKWLWASPAKNTSEFHSGLKRGEAFWFVKASYPTGATTGTLAGSHSRPANDDRPAHVAFGSGMVSIASIGSNGTNTLIVATQRGKDGLFAAAFFANTGLPGLLMVNAYEGYCR